MFFFCTENKEKEKKNEHTGTIRKGTKWSAENWRTKKRIAAKKNEEIRKIVEENYGEVDGSNLEIFRRVMQEQSGQMKQRKEHLKQN